MTLKVIGAGVGRTGTHSLKLALEQLLGGPCHHMVEVFANPGQLSAWTDAIEGRPVDWQELMQNYMAQVDWPGASFWPELLDANPEAIVLLSVRNPDKWFKSASNTIFLGMRPTGEDIDPWMMSMRVLMGKRFSDKFDDPSAMIDAYERHNAAVRKQVPDDRLLEWTVSDGWAPICDKLGLPVPAEPFPVTNSTNEFRTRQGLSPVG